MAGGWLGAGEALAISSAASSASTTVASEIVDDNREHVEEEKETRAFASGVEGCSPTCVRPWQGTCISSREVYAASQPAQLHLYGPSSVCVGGFTAEHMGASGIGADDADNDKKSVVTA